VTSLDDIRVLGGDFGALTARTARELAGVE
jgi:hypothetical protein